MEALTDRSNYHFFYIGLEKTGDRWTYIDGTRPPPPDYHWSNMEPGVNDGVAFIKINLGDPDDLNTNAVPRTQAPHQYFYALCEYNCEPGKKPLFV